MNVNIKDGRFLVTGGSGFIGTHLIRELLRSGAKEVRVIDPLPPQVTDARVHHSGTDLDGATLMAADGVEGVFHMAVLPLRDTSNDPGRAIGINLGGTHSVIQAARNHGCRIVFSSASSVYGETEHEMNEQMLFRPTTFYGASKAASELWLMAALSEWKVPYLTLRYMNVYGPGQKGGLIPAVIRKIRAGEAPQLEGDGSAEFDFVYVGDIVQANLLAMASERVGESYNVGSGEKATVLTVTRKLIDLAGVDLKPSFVPEKPGAVKRRVGSSEKISRDLGYQPSVSLDQGLKQTWEDAS